jgi:hypothetical protein
VSRVSSSNFISIDDDRELFVSSCSGGFTGNERPGLNEYSATTDRLGLGLRGLEGDALARDRDNQPFLGLGRRRVPAKTACETVDCLAWRDGCNFFVDESCSRRRRQE